MLLNLRRIFKDILNTDLSKDKVWLFFDPRSTDRIEWTSTGVLSTDKIKV